MGSALAERSSEVSRCERERCQQRCPLKSLAILYQSVKMSVIDSMTMSAPAPGYSWRWQNQPTGSGERSRTMIIIGVDFHPEFQQIALLNTTTGEVEEKRLAHPDEAEKFYRALASANETVRIGMEASGHARWFERLMAELQFELWIGDAAEIRTRRVRKQKTDRQDAQLILRLMMEDRFPQIWVPSWENRDLRQLLWHRHRMVQARTRIMNQLQAVALNEGLRCKKRLWRERGRQQLESFQLAPWASRRRRDLLELLDRLNPTIAELSQAIEQEVEKCPEAQRLRTHPGVGALTALAFVLIIGKAERF